MHGWASDGPTITKSGYNAGWAYFALMRSLSQASGGFLTGQNTEASLAALKTSINHAEAALRLDPHSSEAIRLLAIDYNMAGSIIEFAIRRGRRGTSGRVLAL